MEKLRLQNFYDLVKGQPGVGISWGLLAVIHTLLERAPWILGYPVTPRPWRTWEAEQGLAEAPCRAPGCTIITWTAVTKAGDPCSLGVTPGTCSLVAHTPHFRTA